MDDTRSVIGSSVCALLRDESAPWPISSGTNIDTRVRDFAAYHGVAPLLSRRLSSAPPGAHHGVTSRHPAPELRDDVAIELLRKHELVRVLNALAESGVNPLLLKGTALAYSLYPSPVLRPRADTDLLINSDDRAVTARVLTELGYVKPNAVSGELVTYQCGYVLRDRFCVEHVLDVHWRVNNTQLFSRALGYEELAPRSIPIAALGDHARGLALADAMLLACMHRAHHLHAPYRIEGIPSSGGDRLIWLYDIHLLVGALSHQGLVEFARLAGQKGMRAVCGDGLLKARECFGTRIPEEVLHSLSRTGPKEPSEAQLQAGKARRLLTELRSLPRWRDRVTLLGEHLFPPPAYMLEKYALTSRAWLPMLYLQRGIHGTWKRIYKL